MTSLINGRHELVITSSYPVDPKFKDLVVVVLAAGRGERFLASGVSTHKLQAMLQGKKVLQHVIDTVEEAGLPMHVVYSNTVSCPTGMGDSIAQGVRATSQANGWLILPGDMPLLQSKTLRAVALRLLEAPMCAAVQPVWNGQTGHPVGFSARCADALKALNGDFGARSVLQTLRCQGLLEQLPVNDPGIALDVDTVSDLVNLEKIWLSSKAVVTQ